MPTAVCAIGRSASCSPASSRLANTLAGRGISKGDRVAVFLSQSAELTICHLAGYRMGAVVLPLFTLFGEEALEYRMGNAEASALITDMSQLPKVLAVREKLPHLKTIIVIGAGKDGARLPRLGPPARRGVRQLQDRRHRTPRIRRC